MKIISFILATVLVVSLINIVNANERKQRSTNVFRERLLDLLLEAKRQEFLYNKYKESEKEFPSSDENPFNEENDYARTYVRRKVVGISDNPF